MGVLIKLCQVINVHSQVIDKKLWHVMNGAVFYPIEQFQSINQSINHNIGISEGLRNEFCFAVRTNQPGVIPSFSDAL